MKINPKKSGKILGLAAVALALPLSAQSQVLFSDDFQTDSSTNWKIYGISGNGVTADYSAQFAFNYSTQTYRFNGVTNFIPPSPNSGATTKGLKVTVNKDGNANIAAVSLYPIGQSFTNDYALKFDLWMDYNGDVPFGGDGSTEFSSFGLNHLGTEVNWPNSPQSGDGVWFSVTGDGGASRDYREFTGDPGGAPNQEVTGTTGGFPDRDGDGVSEQNAPDDGSFSPFQLMFHPPSFQTPGAIGKHWVQVEVRQRGGVITWLMDGYIMAEQPFNNGFSSGNIMLGYMDPYNAEIASPPDENYAIFDNVRVIDLTASTPLPEINVFTPDPNASEPGTDTGLFTITRSGSTASPLTVNLQLSGTASNGVDYVTIPSSITFPAGVSSSNLTVQVINDFIGEPTETVYLDIAGNPGVYEVRTNFGLVSIADDGDLPVATVTATRAVAYENARTGKFTVNFANPNSFDTTVNYTLTGTATNGVDYVTVTNKALIPAGLTSALITVTPINNLKIDGNRTVNLTLNSGTGYLVGSTSNATVTIQDDDLPPGKLLFSENFDSPSSANGWVVNQSDPISETTFAYDYGADGIPPAPNTTNGTTLGLKFVALSSDTAGISVSPIGGNFTGDYRLRFDMWINYNGPMDFGGSQSTECFDAGIGTSGDHPNWDDGNGDGVWFAVTGDGGYSDDYEIWLGPNEQGNGPMYNAGSRNNTAAYYSVFGGDEAPQIQQDTYVGIQTGETSHGNGGFAWHDVVIAKQGTNITWAMDGLQIAHLSTTLATLSTNIFVGYMDDSSGAAPLPALSFGLVDNLRVESLLTRPIITKIAIVGSNVQIDFSGAASDTTDLFTIQGSVTLNGGFADVSPAAGITSLGSGSFRATTPINGPTRFFRVKH
jgi:hypothetical protein